MFRLLYAVITECTQVSTLCTLTDDDVRRPKPVAVYRAYLLNAFHSVVLDQIYLCKTVKHN